MKSKPAVCTIRLPSLSAGHCLTGSVDHTLASNLVRSESNIVRTATLAYHHFPPLPLSFHGSGKKVPAGAAIKSRVFGFARDIKLFHQVAEQVDILFSKHGVLPIVPAHGRDKPLSDLFIYTF